MKGNIEEIAKSYIDQIKDKKIFFFPNIPKKKIKYALDSYAKGVKEEDVLVLIDNTLLGKAKFGALITPTTFYSYGGSTVSQHIKINKIETIYLEEGLKGSNCKLYINGIMFIETYMPEPVSMLRVTEMLEKMSRKLRPKKSKDKEGKLIEKKEDKDDTAQGLAAKALKKTRDKRAIKPFMAAKYDERINVWNVTVKENLSSEAIADFSVDEDALRKLWRNIPEEIVVYPPPVSKEQLQQGKAIFSLTFDSTRTSEYLGGGRGYRFRLSVELRRKSTGLVIKKTFKGETPDELQGYDTLDGTAAGLLWNQINNFDWILPKACRFMLNDFSVLLDTRGGKKEKLVNFLSSTKFSSKAPEMKAAICALKGDWEGCARFGADSVRILTLCLGTDDHKKCSRHLVAMGPDIISYIEDMVPHMSGDGLERAKIVIKRIKHTQ